MEHENVLSNHYMRIKIAEILWDSYYYNLEMSPNPECAVEYDDSVDICNFVGKSVFQCAKLSMEINQIYPDI